MTIAPVGGTPVGPQGPSPRAQGAGAEGFERLMLAQLTKTLVDSAMGEQAGPYASLLPDTLADALAAGGGIGLAASLDRSAPR